LFAEIGRVIVSEDLLKDEDKKLFMIFNRGYQPLVYVCTGEHFREDNGWGDYISPLFRLGIGETIVTLWEGMIVTRIN
jgi:hypothetical protein